MPEFKDSIQKFAASFEYIFEHLDQNLDHSTILSKYGLNNYSVSPQVTGLVSSNFKQILEYNLTGGKFIRGGLVHYFVNTFLKDCKSDLDDWKSIEKKSFILGWCVEIMQAVFLILDDIMDNSITRRGKPCWYKQPSVGLRAINDAFMMENFIYKLLGCYLDPTTDSELCSIFHSINLSTSIGQFLDMYACSESAKKDYTNFTSNYYFQMIESKTSFYTFHLPFLVAFTFSKTIWENNSKRVDLSIGSSAPHSINVPFSFCTSVDTCLSILLDIGHLFQVQDDYLDFFGDPNVTGKIGTDIVDGKCSWLFITALNSLSVDQSELLKNNYGINSEPSLATVKQLYQKADLDSKFKSYEIDQTEKIQSTISTIESVNLQNSLTELLKILCNRKK